MRRELLGWRPGLEGLRGIAVLAVMLYHFDTTHSAFPGGSLGVDIFFVLSGFLITTLLLEERWRTGAISLAAFYKRRARRLLPALGMFLAVFTLVTIVAAQPGVRDLPLTIGTVQLYVFNWVDDLGGVTTLGVGHLWSLSVEEQFYLFWPIVVILALRLSQRALLAISIVVFVTSVSLPFWSGREYGSLYSGTDFRAQELMAGAILAQLRFSGLMTPSMVKRGWFRGVLVLAVAFFWLFAMELGSRSTFLFSGMYTVTAILGAIIVCAALYSPPRILASSLVRYVGTRSYALYLWHHAVNFWLRGLDPGPQLAVSLVLSFAAAELSWRLVEQPGSLSRLRGIAGNGLRRAFGVLNQARRPVTARPSES